LLGARVSIGPYVLAENGSVVSWLKQHNSVIWWKSVHLIV